MIRANLGPQSKFNFESFLKDLISCLKEELPQRVEELRYILRCIYFCSYKISVYTKLGYGFVRNAVVRGYSRSENHHTRATSALLLGLLGSPRPEDIQRLLQLLRDRENVVKIRASQALSYCFSF